MCYFFKKPEALKEVSNLEHRQASSSFVDSIMVALTSEKEEVVKTETPAGPGTVAHPVTLGETFPKCDMN